MRTLNWPSAMILGLLIGGCAIVQTGASSETKAALAPMGKLRVAFISVPLYASKDSATGELKGVAVDLGKDLAQRVGVPYEPVGDPNPPALIGGAKSGEWDVALMGINAERAASMDFSAPFMEVEQGYLVRAGVPIATASDVDRAGIRIGVLEKAGADLHLSGTLKNAVLVRIKSLEENYALLDAGKADVIAATKTALFAGAASRAGSRVLDGRFLVEPIGMGVPKERDAAAAAFVGKFVEDAKAQGLVKSAIEHAGLRGVAVAPLK
ncbi:MAG: transporter substrate-binding domain-containing protein [Betaproteobacteria bacterium]|nr:transporter substrate-binding domain-containing protein [Betaproteobacteria bacterium]